ncbi:hypothetical protein A9Q81_07760 [Gammaproteobacteria bacterium 42_54_T18]|nr:hypothetical protein A9Q81_07760 [Gammaproteobacteria bacterium 42_54_T18]
MSLKLVENIANGSTDLSKINREDLDSLLEFSVSNGDFRALEVITNSFTGIFDYDLHQRDWLKSDFFSPIWRIELYRLKKSRIKIIDWEKTTLYDDSKLTNERNSPLLNTFKYWILACDDPLTNGGKLIKGTSVYEAINRVINLINGILINGQSIKLTTMHLAGLNDDFHMALLVKLASEKLENGIYDYHSKVKKHLLQKIQLVSDEEADTFQKAHPFITRTIPNEDQELGLSMSERIKACCWLKGVGYYNGSGKQKEKSLKGNNNVLVPLVYSSQTLALRPSTFSLIEELRLDNKKRNTEFPPLPNKQRSDTYAEHSVQTYITTLKLLTTIHEIPQTSQPPASATKRLSAKRVKEHVKLKNKGRTTTIPPKLVFGLIKNSFEFSHQYQDTILESVLSVLKEGVSYSTTHKHYWSDGKVISTTERAEWIKEKSLLFVHKDLLELGVRELCISSADEDVFTKRRSNHGLFDLYDILIGAIEILVGVIMAKRQDELVSLKPQGNLHPNTDPLSKKGEKTDYELVSIVKKSGNGGKHEENATNNRPITRSIALLIWKLEKFNHVIIENKLNKGELSLFNNLHTPSFKLSKVLAQTYNDHLNAACDYFETPLVKSMNDELLRYYVRQHQLRRFFAMMFFWSKGYDGLDTLRWMLAHTDTEHLYHYISESETGAVLNGIKASYLVDALQNQTLENLDALANSISKRYGVAKENISMSTVANAVEDYEDGYHTVPNVEQLERQAALEEQVLELLNDGSITLEPDFFTVTHDGAISTDFTLVLQVNELD